MFGTEQRFTFMDGTVIDNQVIERRPECLVLSSTMVQKLTRETVRAKGRKVEFSKEIGRLLSGNLHPSSILETTSVTIIETTYGRCCVMISWNYFILSIPRMLVDPWIIRSTLLVQYAAPKGLALVATSEGGVK
jgi:acyl-CoA reductase-like NAD-dependent aldehyde dehydrogenase